MIGGYLKCSIRSDTIAELCCRRWGGGVKEGTQISGLFDSIRGGLITNKGTQQDKHTGGVETVAYFVWEM